MRDSVLFQPIRIGRVTVANRFVRSATHDFMATESGEATARQVELFGELAAGEIGLIITGHAYVSPAGKASPRQLAVDADRRIPGLRSIAEAVHRHPSRVFLQLAHAGRQTKEKISGSTPLAPSAVYEPVFKVMPRAMTEEDIQAVIRDFVAASRRAREAGFDGVQLHAAHGYLLSSFLSPYTNRREDDYGGSLENRARVVSLIIQGIKNKTGADFPVLIKLNSSDFIAGGLTVEECIQAAILFESVGLDGIEVSGGMSEAGLGSMWPGIRPVEEEGYFGAAAASVKHSVRIPVIGLGGFRTFAAMENAVVAGKMDLVSMSRPFIRQPWLVAGFRRGEIQKSDCISCNKCLNPRGIRCAELFKKEPSSSEVESRGQRD